MTYLEQLDIIKRIPLREGDRKVITCPFCYMDKKLSISKIDGTLMWNCFRASCEGKGIYTGDRTIEYVKNRLNNIKADKPTGKPLPAITTSISNHQPALDYLESVNSLEAYNHQLIKIRYAPSENRVIFYYANGAVGRLLSGFGPKWITYGSIDSGVVVGTGNKVVMVEDIPSACSVSRINGLVGLALLGTKLSYNITKTLKKYQKRYLVLDRDASLHALTQARKHGYNIHVCLTKSDLKVLSTNQIKKVLYGDY